MSSYKERKDEVNEINEKIVASMPKEMFLDGNVFNTEKLLKLDHLQLCVLRAKARQLDAWCTKRLQEVSTNMGEAV